MLLAGLVDGRAGDSLCRFSSFSGNGTLTGRVALTGERDGYAAAVDRERAAGRHVEEGQCSPRDHGGVGRMTRIGQVGVCYRLSKTHSLTLRVDYGSSCGALSCTGSHSSALSGS